VLWFKITDPNTFAGDIQVNKYAPGSTKGTNLHLNIPGQGQIFPGYHLLVDASGAITLTYEKASDETQVMLTFPAGSTTASRRLDFGSLGNVTGGFAFAQTGNFLFINLANGNVLLQLADPFPPPGEVLVRYAIWVQAYGLALTPGT